MDPKKALEAFRVEEVRQKKQTPKQKYKQSNSIFIIIIVTILGLTTGVGSAYAFGVKEMQPGRYPIDEPSTQPKIEVNIPEVIPVISELSPLKPPIDQPNVQERRTEQSTKKQQQKKKKKTNQQKEHKKKKKPKKTKTNQTNRVDTFPVNEEPTIEPKESFPSDASSGEYEQPSERQLPTDSSSEPEQKQVPVTEKMDLPQYSNEATNNETPIKSNSGDRHQQVVNPKVSDNKQSKISKKTNQHSSSGSTANKQKQVKTNTKNKPIAPETPDPKTKPGKLPDTASNELNHAIVSFLIGSFGVVYFLMRKEESS